MSDTISHSQLYEDSKRFVQACWDNSNTRKAMHEFSRDSDYQALGEGKYRSVFYREDLAEDTEAVVKFPNRIHALDESREHNLDEYKAWNSMDEEMQDDFAEVLEAGEEGNYLVQRRSEGSNILGALRLMIKYRYSKYPSDDLSFSNIGVVDGEDVITDFPWGEIE